MRAATMGAVTECGAGVCGAGLPHGGFPAPLLRISSPLVCTAFAFGGFTSEIGFLRDLRGLVFRWSVAGAVWATAMEHEAQTVAGGVVVTELTAGIRPQIMAALDAMPQTAADHASSPGSASVERNGGGAESDGG
ncbi:hypothetical protein [Streptomyces sp. NPDC001781]